MTARPSPVEHTALAVGGRSVSPALRSAEVLQTHSARAGLQPDYELRQVY